MRSTWIAAAVLLVLLIAFRCVGALFSAELPNFSPLPAIFLCSVVCFRGANAWVLPVTAWLISNPLANLLQGYAPFGGFGPVFVAFATLVAIGLLALPLRGRESFGRLLGAGLAGALFFHVATGAAAWAFGGRYELSAVGLHQALWAGLPSDLLPSWVFLRNLAAANLIFTALFFLARSHRVFSPAEALSKPAERLG